MKSNEALHAGRKGRRPGVASGGEGADLEALEELGLQPTVFYRWQEEFFENRAAAFEQKRLTSHSADQERIAYLEKKIHTKDKVPAELIAEHVALKKTLGNSDRGPGARTTRMIRS